MKLKQVIEASSKTHGPKCGLAIIIAELDKADLADLQSCLADPRYSHTQIARGLTAEGHRTTDNVVANHRNGECACGRQ